MKIIRGTTPTIKYEFNDIEVTDITSAYLTIKADEDIEKDLTTATVGDNYLSWTLTQAETLAFGDKISCMINWLLSDGTRGASDKETILIESNYKEDEIS